MCIYNIHHFLLTHSKTYSIFIRKIDLCGFADLPYAQHCFPYSLTLPKISPHNEREGAVNRSALNCMLFCKYLCRQFLLLKKKLKIHTAIQLKLITSD